MMGRISSSPFKRPMGAWRRAKRGKARPLGRAAAARMADPEPVRRRAEGARLMEVVG